MSKKYKRNYLDSVIFRVDFDVLEDEKKLKKCRQKLEQMFPFKEESKGLEGTFEIDVVKDSYKSDKKEILTWDYFDTYKSKKVRVTSKFLVVEYLNRSYSDSKELLLDIENIVEVFVNDLGIDTYNRIGLRYINRFDFDIDVSDLIDWNKYFNRDLIGAVNFAKKVKYPISRAMTNLHIRFDEHDTTIRYGIWNQDFPSKNTKKEFILDIDAFSRFAVDADSGLSEIVKSYNKSIETIFEKSIGEETRKILNKKRK